MHTQETKNYLQLVLRITGILVCIGFVCFCLSMVIGRQECCRKECPLIHLSGESEIKALYLIKNKMLELTFGDDSLVSNVWFNGHFYTKQGMYYVCPNRSYPKIRIQKDGSNFVLNMISSNNDTKYLIVCKNNKYQCFTSCNELCVPERKYFNGNIGIFMCKNLNQRDVFVVLPHQKQVFTCAYSISNTGDIVLLGPKEGRVKFVSVGKKLKICLNDVIFDLNHDDSIAVPKNIGALNDMLLLSNDDVMIDKNANNTVISHQSMRSRSSETVIEASNRAKLDSLKKDCDNKYQNLMAQLERTYNELLSITSKLFNSTFDTKDNKIRSPALLEAKYNELVVDWDELHATVMRYRNRDAILKEFEAYIAEITAQIKRYRLEINDSEIVLRKLNDVIISRDVEAIDVIEPEAEPVISIKSQANEQGILIDTITTRYKLCMKNLADVFAELINVYGLMKKVTDELGYSKEDIDNAINDITNRYGFTVNELNEEYENSMLAEDVESMEEVCDKSDVMLENFRKDLRFAFNILSISSETLGAYSNTSEEQDMHVKYHDMIDQLQDYQAQYTKLLDTRDVQYMNFVQQMKSQVYHYRWRYYEVITHDKTNFNARGNALLSEINDLINDYAKIVHKTQ